VEVWKALAPLEAAINDDAGDGFYPSRFCVDSEPALEEVSGGGDAVDYWYYAMSPIVRNIEQAGLATEKIRKVLGKIRKEAEKDSNIHRALDIVVERSEQMWRSSGKPIFNIDADARYLERMLSWSQGHNVDKWIDWYANNAVV